PIGRGGLLDLWCRKIAAPSFDGNRSTTLENGSDCSTGPADRRIVQLVCDEQGWQGRHVSGERTQLATGR
ncbi:MAG: hypothetical protein ABGZ53_08710, partial [Fuerstiella sp.]